MGGERRSEGGREEEEGEGRGRHSEGTKMREVSKGVLSRCLPAAAPWAVHTFTHLFYVSFV